MGLSIKHPFAEAEYRELAGDLVKRAKRHNVDHVEVFLSEEKGFSVSARAGDVENLEHHREKGLAVTVYMNQRMGSASTSDFSKQAIEDALQHAISIAKHTQADPYAGIADKDYQAYEYPDLNLYHHWEITPREAIEKMIECETIAREQDKRILDSEGATLSTYDKYFVFANSNDFVGGYPTSSHNCYCEVVVDDKGNMQRDYEYTAARNPDDLFDTITLAKQAAAKTIKRLGAKKIKTQKCPVIFHADLAKGLLGSFIAAIKGANLYRKTTFLLDKLGEQVLPDFISLTQHPHLLGMLGSAAFDGEGVRTNEREYVKDGVLTSYVLGSYSARKLGLCTTGNAGGVYNLAITHSDKNLDALLKEMDTGLLVTELMGQGVNILTGDYSRGAFGYWVENGVIQYPVEEITIAGNLADMLRNIVAVGNDIDRRSRIHTGSILLNEMIIAGS